MSQPTNKARQLLALPTLFEQHSNRPLAVAIDEIASQDAEGEALRDQLYVILATLPSQVERQGYSVLGDRFSAYSEEVTRVVAHFRGHSPNNTWEQMATIYEKPVVIALNAVADLVDAKLGLEAVDEKARVDLDAKVRQVIQEIQEDESLDAELRGYLLSVAVHLRVMLEHFALFGADGIADLQGHFFTDLRYKHPDLWPDDASEEHKSTGKGFVRTLWDLTCIAGVLAGLPNDAIELAGHVRALLPGS